jgi:hypothetical protein
VSNSTPYAIEESHSHAFHGIAIIPRILRAFFSLCLETLFHCPPRQYNPRVNNLRGKSEPAHPIRTAASGCRKETLDLLTANLSSISWWSRRKYTPRIISCYDVFWVWKSMRWPMPLHPSIPQTLVSRSSFDGPNIPHTSRSRNCTIC